MPTVTKTLSKKEYTLPLLIQKDLPALLGTNNNYVFLLFCFLFVNIIHIKFFQKISIPLIEDLLVWVSYPTPLKS